MDGDPRARYSLAAWKALRMKQLSGLDSVFVFLERKHTPMHIGGMVIYDPSTAPDGEVPFSQILDNLAGRLGRVEALRQRLVRLPYDLDNPWWVEDAPVDLECHVERLALPEPADWRELCSQAGRFMSRPLDMSRPPWELCIIEGLDGIEDMPRGAFAMVLKIHHAAIDGVSGLEMISVLHDRSPVPDSVRVEQNGDGLESASLVGLLARAVPNVVRKPWRLLEVAAGLGPELSRRMLSADVDVEPTPKARPTRFNALVGPRRTVGGVRFELAEIKRVKNAVPGASVNDVVLALVGGALRRYLDGVGELPAESLIAAMPISLRSEQEKAGGGNKLAVAALPLGTDVADPLDRVRQVHDTATRRKAVRDGEGAERLVKVADGLPAGLMGLAGQMVAKLGLTDKVTLFNTAVSNVPGPSRPIYMAGARVVDVYGFGLVPDNLGLVNMVFSYCGGLTVGFQVGPAMMPDPERYEQYLRQSFAELVDAANEAAVH